MKLQKLQVNLFFEGAEFETLAWLYREEHNHPLSIHIFILRKYTCDVNHSIEYMSGRRDLPDMLIVTHLEDLDSGNFLQMSHGIYAR